ncbi:MAG: hypothetical protein K6A63_07560 [Acholeplasmatales bacterium]|nr:hypothetical protein [Acholeplasmatales bacterium]
MAQEVTLSLFERNAKNANKSGLARAYNTIPDHITEYIPYPALSTTSKLTLEVTVDKDSADALVKFIKDKGFEFYGDKGTLYLEEAVKQYEADPRKYPGVKPEMIEAIKKDLAQMEHTDYKDAPDDDKVFYFAPYNEGVTTLYEFIKSTKDDLLKFAKDNDITIMVKITGFNSQISGFIGFNFFDADKPEEDIVIDYAARVTVGVDFSNRLSVYNAALFLNAVGENEAELTDEDVNTHIVTEKATNVK